MFCDSEWLVQQEATDQAFDAQNQPVVDNNGNAVPIDGIDTYASQLGANDVPWWSGAFTNPPAYGYAFAPTDNNGGNYCLDKDHAGLTAKIVGHSSTNPNVPVLNGAMIICPSAFDSSQPANLAAGVAKILSGAPASTTIQQALPRSFTLLHEAMHVIFGDDPGVGMLAGGDEFCMLIYQST